MLDQLELFDNGDSFHPAALTDLYALGQVLEAPDPSWADAFQRGVGLLEIDTSIAIVRWAEEGEDPSKDFSYSEETIKRMRATVAELKRLVLQKIEAPADGAEGTD
jgi:hypothetical protein